MCKLFLPTSVNVKLFIEDVIYSLYVVFSAGYASEEFEFLLIVHWTVKKMR